MWAWSSSIRRSISSRSRARSAAKSLHETTDLIAQGLQGNSPMLIDVELDRAFKPM